MNMKFPARRSVTAGIATMVAVAALTGCAGAGGSSKSGGDVTLTLATVNNPQMKDMEELKGSFESENPGIKIKFVQMEENDLRDSVTKDVATKGGQYDIVTVGAYEVPIWAKNGWLSDLTQTTSSDAAYDVADLFPPVRDSLTVDSKLYALPFYGESSLLMYNKEKFAAAGLTMPDHPTWEQVADLAKKLKTESTAGICLRGKPGWGELFASLTTVVQTFGGAWFDENWNAKVNAAEFQEATQFYVDLAKTAGQADPVSSGFTECLNTFTQGKAAMWYDATSAAGTVEDPKASSVAGKVGYVHAPVQKTKESGWLWSWNLGIPETSTKKDAAQKFIKWATSKEYGKLVGQKLGWSRVPPGARTSTYEIPEYQAAAAAFAPITKNIMESVNAKQPGVSPQAWTGVQYVSIPEFPALANQISQDLADVFAGRSDVKTALDKGQKLAEEAGQAQRK